MTTDWSILLAPWEPYSQINSPTTDGQPDENAENDCGENASRFLEHHFAGHGERHTPRRAIQQSRAHLGLELCDLMRDGGLRKIACVRRSGKVAELGHSDECSQMDGIHR